MKKALPRRIIVFMTTLSPTQARSNLTAWLKRAAQGEEIGILYGDKVISLRPVEVESADYAEREYSVTRAEMERIAKKLHARGVRERKAGKTREYKGDIEAVLKG